MLTEETYKDYDFEWLYDHTGDPEDRRVDNAFMLVEMVRQSLIDERLLARTIERIRGYMNFGRPFPPSLGQLAFEKLVREGVERIRMSLVDYVSDWSVDRQMNAFDHFPPDISGEEDRVLASQIKLLDMQERYDFKPKFEIIESAEFAGVPELRGINV
jgi:hypothetical protein